MTTLNELRRPGDALTADVAIIGFGPVGKLLAIHLGRRGHTVVAVERELGGYPLPRAVTHCSDFARILQSVGLSPATIPEITQPYDDMYVWRNGEGQTLIEVELERPGRVRLAQYLLLPPAIARGATRRDCR